MLIMKRMTTKQKIALILFGLFLCMILLETGLRIGGFIILSLQEYRNMASIREKGEYRIMCLGESTTADGGKYSYPSQLEDILNEQDLGVKFSVINNGVRGTVTGVILSQLEGNLDRYNPDMVITMMGENDDRDFVFYEDKNFSHAEKFFKTLKIYKLSKLIWLHSLDKLKVRLIIDEDKEMNSVDAGLDFLGAKSYADQGKHDQAKQILKEKIKIDPRDDKAYFEYASFYERQNEFHKAIGLFKHAIELNPRNSMTYVELAWCYGQLDDIDNSERFF